MNVVLPCHLGAFLQALRLTLPDEATGLRPIPHIRPGESGRLRAVELGKNGDLAFTFDLAGGGGTVTGGCAELESHMAPVLFSPDTAPLLRVSHRALINVVEDGEQSCFYTATGAGYTEVLKMLESAEYALSRRPGTIHRATVIADLAVKDLPGGCQHGSEAKRMPYQQLSEPQAARLRESMAYTPNICVEITADLDAGRVAYRHNPLSSFASTPPPIDVDLDNARRLLEECAREAREQDPPVALQRGLYPHAWLEHRMFPTPPRNSSRRRGQAPCS